MVQFLFLCFLFFSVTWGVPSIVTFGYMGGAHYFFCFNRECAHSVPYPFCFVLLYHLLASLCY